jgi:hypothetical protein
MPDEQRAMTPAMPYSPDANKSDSAPGNSANEGITMSIDAGKKVLALMRHNFGPILRRNTRGNKEELLEPHGIRCPNGQRVSTFTKDTPRPFTQRSSTTFGNAP